MPTRSPAPPNRIHVLEVVGGAIVGGVESYVERLIERLPPERFRVSVLCPFESRYADRLRALGADVVVVAMPDNPTWSAIQLACALIKADAIDVVHAHLSNAHALAGLAGKLTGKPVLATVHGRQLTTTDLEVHRTSGTELCVVCRQTYFQALGVGVNAAQLHLIPNGVDVERFSPAAAAPRPAGPLRQRFGIDAAAPLIGFVGRLDWEKGPDVFLRAAVSVRQTFAEAHFMLAGDGPLRERLQGFIERYGLAGHVHFAGVQTDMPAVYREFDIAVSSSRTEAMPFALMEAMASGLPVVATGVGGLPEMVQDGVTGWLVGDGDAEAIAAKLVALLGDAPARAEMGHAARRRAVERMSLADSTAQLMQLLTRLAPSRGDARRISAVPSDAKPLTGVNGSNGVEVPVPDAASRSA